MVDIGNNNKDSEKHIKKLGKDIEKIDQTELDELKGLSFDEIFKLFSGYDLPTNEIDEIKVAEKLKTTRFRLKICISIITKNKIIANYVKFLQFFDRKYLQTTISGIEDIEIPYATVWSFVQNMFKTGFLFGRKITFKSAHKRKKYPHGIGFFWVKDCPEELKSRMYEHLEEDKFLYSKEMRLLAIKELELQIKINTKTQEEIVDYNLNSKEMYEIKKKEIRIAKIEEEQKKKLCDHGKLPNECGKIESCPNYKWERLNRDS